MPVRQVAVEMSKRYIPLTVQQQDVENECPQSFRELPMRTPIAAAVAALTLPLVASVPATAASPSIGIAAPIACADLAAVALPDTTITSATLVPASAPTPATCRVHAVVTHPPAGDTVNVDVWLPVDGWNGRFQGV